MLYIPINKYINIVFFLFRMIFMRINKFIIIASIFIISLLCISAASAADDAAESDIVADTSDETVLEESIDDASYEDSQSDENALRDGPSNEQTFLDLEEKILNADNEVELTSEFHYNGFDSLIDGVVIDHNLTINGNNHTIDAKNLARIFHVTSNARVIFNDINFINGYTDQEGHGAAIWADENTAAMAIGCSFISNQAAYGAAVEGVV